MVYHSIGCEHTPNRGKLNRLFSERSDHIVGVFNGEGPPVPIPNTEVKLTSADNTCLETDREDRSMPTQRICVCRSSAYYASLAQQVEHAAVNRRVVGSNPTGGATEGCRHTGWRHFSNHGALAQSVRAAGS